MAMILCQKREYVIKKLHRKGEIFEFQPSNHPLKCMQELFTTRRGIFFMVTYDRDASSLE